MLDSAARLREDGHVKRFAVSTYADRLAEFQRVTGHKPGEMNKVSLEPPRQSAGPGRCNRFTRAGALGDPTPCKLPANHEGPHEP